MLAQKDEGLGGENGLWRVERGSVVGPMVIIDGWGPFIRYCKFAE